MQLCVDYILCAHQVSTSEAENMAGETVHLQKSEVVTRLQSFACTAAAVVAASAFARI